MHARYEQEAARLRALFPEGPRLAVIGSTSFWHADSERTCTEVGRMLARIPGLVLITGGVEGVGEATGRAFFRARHDADEEPRVYHVLPEGEEAWDYGQTFFAGLNMAQRREVLARLSSLYLAVEGGPGTVHEAAVASSRGAVVIPVGRSGGHSADLYARMSRPKAVDIHTWALLGSAKATPEETADSALNAVRFCLEAGNPRQDPPGEQTRPHRP
jgi:uncharacterized protein (TIGR00725 family)